MDKDWKAVATAINTRMGELGMTQAELAQRSGVSSATLRKLQRNYAGTSPTRRTLEDVSRALRWPADRLQRLLNGDEQAESEDSELERLRSAVAELQARVGSIESELHKRG